MCKSSVVSFSIFIFKRRRKEKRRLEEIRIRSLDKEDKKKKIVTYLVIEIEEEGGALSCCEEGVTKSFGY